MAFLLVFAMVFSIGTTVMTTEASAAAPTKIISPRPQRYTIDMTSISDQQMRDSQVAIRFEFDDKTPVNIKGDDYMGYPVLMNVPSLGGVTLIPIRLICEAIGVPVDWIPASEDDDAHALIKSPDHGDVKLYMGATSIQAEDGTYYQETTYTFPDGSPIPLCLFRNGRTYVPVRFITSFLVNNATFSWSQNMQLLTIRGSLTEQEIDTPWEGKGVNYNIEIPLDNPIANMSNTAAVAEKYGYTPKTTTGGQVHVGFSNMSTMSNGCMITGFAWESNAADVWEIQTAMIKDMLDAESANAFLSWLNHANELQKAYFDAEVGSQEEANALAQLEKEIAPIIDSDSTRFGNVDVTFECSENGFPQSIVFENVN